MPPHYWHFQPGICQLYDLHMWAVHYLGTAQDNNKKDSSLECNVETFPFTGEKLETKVVKRCLRLSTCMFFQVISDLIEFRPIQVVRKKRSSPAQC